jgi:hypothetical protein
MLTARTEVTGQILAVSQRHLPAILTQHQARHNRDGRTAAASPRPPRPGHPAAGLTNEPINRQPVPGGLINKHHQAA